MTGKIEQLREWIAGLREDGEAVVLEDDTDLINSGVITSLEFVQMVMEIERLNGARLEPGVITIDRMRTLAAIDKAVFQAAGAETV